MNASRWDRREVGAAHSRAHERHYRTRPPQRSTITDTRPHHARDELRARSPVPVGRHYRSRSLTFNESRSHASERHFPPHRSRSPRAFRSRSPRPRSPRPRSPRRNQGREPPYWSRPGSPRRCSPRRNQSREPPYSSRSRLSRPHPNNNSNHARLPRKRSRSKSPHSRSASMSRLNMSRRDLSHSHPQEEFPRLPLSSASRPVPQQADVERARPLQQQQQQQQTLPESADDFYLLASKLPTYMDWKAIMPFFEEFQPWDIRPTAPSGTFTIHFRSLTRRDAALDKLQGIAVNHSARFCLSLPRPRSESNVRNSPPRRPSCTPPPPLEQPPRQPSQPQQAADPPASHKNQQPPQRASTTPPAEVPDAATASDHNSVFSDCLHMVMESLAHAVGEKAWPQVIEAPAYAFLETWARKPSQAPGTEAVEAQPQAQSQAEMPAQTSNDDAPEIERSSPDRQPSAEPMPARQHASGSCRTEGYYRKQKETKSGALEQSGGAESKREDRLQRRHFQRATASAGGSSVLQANQLQIRNKKLKLERSSIHDWGVRTEEPISEGDFVVEYIGEYVRSKVAELREKRYERSGIDSSYLFRVDEDWVIDATKAGNLARYLNHSCSPNCKTKVVTVDKKKRVVIYAKRSISAGEELTYDYKFPLEPDNKIPCHCGSRRCRGSLN